ncbi:MAG: hypothetical protein LBC07_02370, partial [Elusimicrobiota bacterium]|nr:hypothetical protein [Elusimicrobiota bacterium]
MTTKNLPFKIILSFLFLFQSILLFAYEIDIKADSLEYAQEFDRVKASGNVYIAWSDRYMYADEIEFIFTDNSIRAKGNVELFENGSMLYADEITYFYDDEKGELVQTKIVSNFAFMQAQKMERINNNNFLAKKITISNCDLDDPHTSFRAGSAKLEM